MVLLRIIVAKVQWSEFHEKTKGEIRHETNRHEFKMRELLASSSASPVRQSRRVTDGTPAAYLRIRRLLSGSGQSCRNSSIRLRALSSFRNSLDAFRMLSSIVAIAALVSCALAQPVNGVSATVVEVKSFPLRELSCKALTNDATQTRLIRFEARNTLDANFNFTLASQPSFRSQRLPLFRNVLSEEMNCVPQRINLQGIQATRDNNLKLVITLVGGQVRLLVTRKRSTDNLVAGYGVPRTAGTERDRRFFIRMESCFVALCCESFLPPFAYSLTVMI